MKKKIAGIIYKDFAALKCKYGIKNGPEIVSAENPFDIRHCVICVMTMDLMQNSERWLNDQIFKMDFQFWADWPG